MVRNSLITTAGLIALISGLLLCSESIAGQGTGTRMKGLPGRVLCHGDNPGSRTQRSTLVGFSQKQNATIRFAAHPGGVNRVLADCTANQLAKKDSLSDLLLQRPDGHSLVSREKPGGGVRHCATRAVMTMIMPVLVLNLWLTWTLRDCIKEVPEMPRLLLPSVPGVMLGASVLYLASERFLATVLAAWVMAYLLLRVLLPNLSIAGDSRRRLAPAVGFGAGWSGFFGG